MTPRIDSVRMTTEKLLRDFATTGQVIEEQNEIAQYIFGIVARRDGNPMDRTKSLAWQRGWAEVQESHFSAFDTFRYFEEC
jgi:hypothetical protein